MLYKPCFGSDPTSLYKSPEYPQCNKSRDITDVYNLKEAYMSIPQLLQRQQVTLQRDNDGRYEQIIGSDGDTIQIIQTDGEVVLIIKFTYCFIAHICCCRS